MVSVFHNGLSCLSKVNAMIFINLFDIYSVSFMKWIKKPKNSIVYWVFFFNVKVQSNIFFCKNFNKSHLTNTHYIPAFCTQHVPRCHPNDHHTQFPSLLQNLPRLFRLTETIHQPDVCPLKMLLFPYNTTKSIFI